MFARGAACACSPVVRPDHKEPGGYQVLLESEKTVRRVLDLVVPGGAVLEVTRGIVESLSNPLFHDVKSRFILTSRRFYLQSNQRQAKSPSLHHAGRGTDLAVTLRRSSRRRSRPNADAGSSKSLQKALRLLVHLGEYGPEMGITQLAGELRLNKTTVYRLLNALQKFELIEKNSANQRYRLGLKLHELGCRALESRTLRGEAHEFLVEMSRRSNESVSIAVPGEASIVCLDRVDCLDSIITARTPIGGRFQAHCTAAGKAILAYLSQAEIHAILKRNGMPHFTSATLIKYADLMNELDLTRRRGFATDSEELETGLSGVAAPIFMRGSLLVAAVGIAGPTQRFMGDEFNRKVALVQDFAARLSRSLGRRTSELPVATHGKICDPFSSEVQGNGRTIPSRSRGKFSSASGVAGGA